MQNKILVELAFYVEIALQIGKVISTARIHYCFERLRVLEKKDESLKVK